MAVPGALGESMDKIFARIVKAEEREGIRCYYGSESWGNAAKGQNTQALANLRSQPASPQRAAVERMALRIAIENFAPEYAETFIEKISIPKATRYWNFAIGVAANCGNLAILRLSFARGADVNYRRTDGNTILMIAAKAGHEAVVKLLLEKGASINQRNEDNSTALMIAADAGHEAVVKLLLEKGADPSFTDRDRQTALMIAAEAGHEAVVKLLLEKGASINQRNEDNSTALMIAADAGHEAVVKLLLEKGAHPSFTNKGRQTALMIAADTGHEAVVKLLLQYGADNDEKPLESVKQYWLGLSSGKIKRWEYNRGGLVKDTNQPTSSLTERQASGSQLIEAAKQGHEKVVTRLLEESRFRFRARQALGDALIEAAKQGHEKVVTRLLEESRFHFRARQALGDALIQAVEQGHEKVVRYFHKYGTWILMKETVMIRCLFTAVQNGQSEMVDALLSSIENSRLATIVNSFDEHERTPLHWAVKNGDEKKVMLLIEAGSSVAFLDSCGMSPLQLAAISGVTPLEPDASRKYLAEKDSSADVRRSFYTKMELGLGFGESSLIKASQVILISSDTGNISPYDGGFPLYDFILHGVARSLESLPPFEIFSNPTYISRLRSWGSSLVGGHIRFAIGHNTSAIVRLDRMFGFGSELDGRTFLQTLIAFEESINGETNRFRLRQVMRASSPKHQINLRRHQLLTWFVGLAHSASKHQEKRAKTIQSKKARPVSVGSCWRDAFGDILEVDLREHFNASNAIRLNPTFWPQNTDNQARNSNDLTLSTIEYLASALGIYSETTVDGMLFWKGHRGICVLVGVLPHKNIPFWHVCTIEQSSYLEADPQSFVQGIKSNRDSILEVDSKPQALCDCSKVTSFQGIILVGALVEPSWCEKVDCDGLFQAQGENIQAGRLAPEERRQGLQWSNITGQLQFSMGAQGPQGSVVVGGELARNSGHELLMAENSLAHGLTTLERALRSWVLVYQSSNGQVTQQNLYCIVSCFLMNETSEITFHQESSAGTESAQDWADRRVTLVRACSTIIAAPMPAFLNGKMGGLDLAAIVKECARIWVWESPPSHLGWVTILGTLPAVSVRSLGEVPSRPSLQRCTLFISVGRLEQIVGRLYRVEALRPIFESEMVRIKLRGFNDASLKEAQRAGKMAKTLRWTESIKAIMPGRRFGGQGPSSMEHMASTKIWDYVLLLANKARESGYRTGCDTLGNIANGTELTGDSVGLLIECI